jgi:hypothetical protein
MNLAAKMTLETAGFLNPLAGVQAAMSGAVSSFRSAMGPLATLSAAILGVGSVSLGFKKAIDEAANMEQMQTSFSVLLGSMDAAKTRMAELSKFAADTPFELPEVAAASRTLETLTRGALATGKGLTLVGDVASGTNAPFEELAVMIGRMYDGLQSGRPVGEAMQRLQELGVISGNTRAKIEQLQNSGKKGDEVWNVAAQAMGRFSGMMAQQSQTWNGLMSTFQDNIGAAFRAFGEPLLDRFKPILQQGLQLADMLAPKAQAAGEALADSIGVVTEILKTDNLDDLLSDSLKLAGMEFVNLLSGGIIGIGRAIGTTLGTLLSGMMSDVPTFLGALNLGLRGVVEQMGVALLSVFEKPIAAVQAGMEYTMQLMMEKLGSIPGLGKALGLQGFKAESFDDVMKDHEQGNLFGFTKTQLQANAANDLQTSGDMLKGLYSGFSLKGLGKDIADDMKDGLKEGKVFDTSGLSGDIGAYVSQMRKQAGDIQATINKNLPVSAGKSLDNSVVSTSKHGAKFEEGDRLAKIGLFVGSGGPAADYHRKTAENTGKLVQIMSSGKLKSSHIQSTDMSLTWAYS